MADQTPAPIQEDAPLELTHVAQPEHTPSHPRPHRNWGQLLRRTFTGIALLVVVLVGFMMWQGRDRIGHDVRISPETTSWAQGCTQDISSCRGNLVVLNTGYTWRLEGTTNDSARLASMMDHDLTSIARVVRVQDGNPQDPYVAATIAYYGIQTQTTPAAHATIPAPADVPSPAPSSTP